MRIGIVNAKGGVGKTTTAIGLAAGLAEHKYSTLLLDTDFQASASVALGVKRSELNDSSLCDLLLGDLSASEVKRLIRENLTLINACGRLRDLDIVLADHPRREFLLRDLLQTSEFQTYQYIVADMPASLTLLTVNVLVACDYLIIPVQPHYLAVEGLATLLEELSTLRSNLGGIVGTILGILPVICDRRQRVALEMIDSLRETLGELVFNVEVPYSVKQAEAPSFSQTIYEYSPRSAAALAYRQFTGEVIARIEKRKAISLQTPRSS